MNRRDAVLALVSLGAAPFASAQQTEKMYRVGMVFAVSSTADITGPEPTNPIVLILLRELRALGYVEGKNLIFDRLSAEGHPERYAEIVAELLRRKPHVIMVPGSQMAAAAKKATSSVPIVMTGVAQPVEFGLVASLARPGGNVTGISADASPEIEGKRLELLKEVVPKLSRVSAIATRWNWEGPYGQAIRRAASVLGIELLYAEYRPDALKATFANIVRQRPHALLVASGPEAYAQRQQIVDFALNAHLPGTYPFAESALAGGLMSYSYSLPDVFRRSASYVNKILKGAKPGDLPVEQPTTFELVINRKTAKALGLTIPQSILVRADRVIE